MDDGLSGAQGRVVRFLAKGSGRRPDTIRLDEALRAFDIDSLDYVGFVMELEDESGADLPDAPILETVGDLVDFVRSAHR